MITSIQRKDAHFPMPELDYPCNLYFSGTVCGAPYAVCHVQYDPKYEIAYVHLSVEKWSKTVIKEMSADFEEIEDMLRTREIKRLVVSHPIEDGELWGKFISKLGFPEPEVQVIQGHKCLISVKEV